MLFVHQVGVAGAVQGVRALAAKLPLKGVKKRVVDRPLHQQIVRGHAGLAAV